MYRCPSLPFTTFVCRATLAEAVSLKDMLGLEKQLRDRNSMLVRAGGSAGTDLRGGLSILS